VRLGLELRPSRPDTNLARRLSVTYDYLYPRSDLFPRLLPVINGHVGAGLGGETLDAVLAFFDLGVRIALITLGSVVRSHLSHQLFATRLNIFTLLRPARGGFVCPTILLLG
jgi:hypothetical protein